MTPFRRSGPSVEVMLGSGLVPGLLDLVDTLDSVGESPHDPAASRLAVPVYLGDVEAQERWEREKGDLIELGRQADRQTFARVVASAERPVSIDVDDAHAIVRVLAELRLMVAARFGLEVEADYEELDEEQGQLLDVLGWLQHLLIEELGP